MAIVAASCSPSTFTVKELVGAYVLNRDSDNSILLSDDGTYKFNYFGHDGRNHAVNGKWQLNQSVGAPHSTIVVDNYNPGSDPNQVWGSYPMMVERRKGKIVLVVTADGSLYYEKR